MSSHNPFRDPPTSKLAESSPSSTPIPQSEPAASSSSAQRTPTPPAVAALNSAAANNAVEPDSTGLNEELPPAYTPGPNHYQGESTVEYGPRRPFQQPPPPPQRIQPQPTGWNTAQNHSGYQRPPSLLSQITGQIVSQLNNNTSGSTYNRYNGPQSVYPGQSVHPQSTGIPPTLPHRPPPQGGYAPPPGHSGPLTQQSPNDGRPTTQPTPGHPLLNANRLLVYPAGHECYKCHNTGYKQNDPSHPCRKCWQKYGKPFTGALAYSSFEQGAEGRENLQRPLPVFCPPQMNQNQNHHHPLPQNRPAQIMPMNGYGRQQNTVMFIAGDPRIGGRQCWRCDGRGKISLLFLEDSCPVCGGIGRVFN